MQRGRFEEQYAVETDDQLVQLAGEQEQLTPEARLRLLSELEKRGINPATHQRAPSTAEETLGGNNLTSKDWQQYRRWTGEWPILSGITFLAKWIVLMSGVMAAVLVGVQRWSKIGLIVAVALWVVVGEILSSRIERLIRLKELRGYRKRRGPTA